MINKVLFIQPFLIEDDSLTDEILVWEVYLENFLKSKLPQLRFDLLYLPVEQKRGKFHLDTIENLDSFHSQMDTLLSSIQFELDKNTLICISGTTSHHYLSSKLIAEYFQKFFPFTIIAFGGAHASAQPNDFRYPNSPIDYIVIGEGELPLYNLIERPVKKQKEPIILNYNPIPSLDEIPPLDLTIFDRYIDDFNHLSISISRGCPFDCTFCMEKNLSENDVAIKRWRVYSPKRAIKEVKTMIDYGLSHNIEVFGFYDPIFGLNKKWLNDFLELYNFNEVKAAWIETRLDILNEDLIAKLYKKKFHSMFGLESYSKRMLSIMNKTANPTGFLNKFEKIIKIHKKLGMFYMLNVLFNHPGETRESSLETFNRLEKLIAKDNSDLVHLNLRYYHHFPGTRAYNNIDVFNQRYGSIAYFPGWWKKEKLLKFGPYGIRPSKELSLREGIDIYTDLYKNLELVKLGRIKTIRPNNLFPRILSIKKDIRLIKNLRESMINFLDENHIEDEKEVLKTVPYTL